MMARRPSPSLTAAVGPQPEAAPPPPPATPKPVSLRAPSRVGKKGIAFWVGPEASTQLKILAATRRTTVQDLMQEATNDLFAKHGRHRIA